MSQRRNESADSRPMGSRLFGTQKVIDLCKNIRMGVEVQEAHRFPLGELTTSQRSYDTGRINRFEKLGDQLDAIFIVVARGNGTSTTSTILAAF